MKKQIVFLLCALFFFSNGTVLAGVLKGSFKNKGASISYRIIGSGKTVLFINGGPGFSSEHMDAFAEKLSSLQYRVILFDQRGTGNSKIPVYDTTTITVDLTLSDIDTLISIAGNQKAIVIGHSFGGILAMSFAHRYPERIEKLVLSSSAGMNLEFLDYFADNIAQRLVPSKAKPAKPPVTLKEREESFYRQLAINAPAYFYNKENVPDFIRMLTRPGCYHPDVNSLLWYDLFKNNYDLTKAFTGFRKPTLVTQGRQDILGDQTALTIHQNIPGSRLVFINRCGHVPWMDQPELFYKTLNDFMKS